MIGALCSYKEVEIVCTTIYLLLAGSTQKLKNLEKILVRFLDVKRCDLNNKYLKTFWAFKKVYKHLLINEFYRQFNVDIDKGIH